MFHLKYIHFKRGYERKSEHLHNWITFTCFTSLKCCHPSYIWNPLHVGLMKISDKFLLAISVSACCKTSFCLRALCLRAGLLELLTDMGSSYAGIFCIWDSQRKPCAFFNFFSSFGCEICDSFIFTARKMD